MKYIEKFLDRYLDLDRPFELLDWVLLLFLLFVFGMAFTQETNAQTRSEIERIIVQSAEAHGINPSLALAIAEVESQMNPRAKGSLGEVGLFQLRPEYHRVIPGNLRANTNTAMKYLARLKRECSHYGEAFFVCYNYGQARPLKYPKLFPYFKKVTHAMNKRNRYESRKNHIASND